MALNPVKAPGLKTFAVDKYWRLYWDETPWDVEQMSEVLVHEVWHILRKHMDRAETLLNVKAKMSDLKDAIHQAKEIIAWRLAVDMEINDSLNHGKMPEGAILPENYGLKKHLLSETYWEKLKEIIEVEECPGGGCDCGSGTHIRIGDSSVPNPNSGSCSDGIPREYEEPSPRDEHGNKNKNPDGSDVAGGIEDLQGELIRRNVAKRITESSKSRGSMPLGAQRWAEELLNPKIDWKRELKGAIRASLANVSGCVDYSYSRPSRRQAALGDVIFPALRSPVPDVAVAVDTSGSMSDDYLAQALAEIKGVLRACGQNSVTCMSVDAQVHTMQKVFSKSQVKLAGGGGTDMGVAINVADKMKHPPNILAIITDGYTPWPSVPPKKIGKVIACILGEGVSGDDYYGCQKPPSWVRTIHIDMKG
jgi:predicted metal-dependent peptidase